jgi:hypothetical protein
MKNMTRDEALDFAFDAYLAGNVNVNVASDASNGEIEDILAPWFVKIEED